MSLECAECEADLRGPHVDGCSATESRRAPVQESRKLGKTGGTLAWWEHEEAWEGYKREFYGSAMQQDAERIAQRGGFSYGELVRFLGHEPSTWEPKSR